MVARGDLGVELELERVPFAQKLLIRKAKAGWSHCWTRVWEKLLRCDWEIVVGILHTHIYIYIYYINTTSDYLTISIHFHYSTITGF